MPITSRSPRLQFGLLAAALSWRRFDKRLGYIKCMLIRDEYPSMQTHGSIGFGIRGFGDLIKKQSNIQAGFMLRIDHLFIKQ